MTKLGATGKFPRGKIRGDDEGQLRGGMVIQDGTLVIYFGKPVTWLGLGVEDLEQWIAQLQEKLAKMKGTPS
jgi:hypothetical protein